jgi:hypothetical protein
MQNGQVEFVEIESQLGGPCRLRNPWKDEEVKVYSEGRKGKNMKGSLLAFETVENQVFVFVPKGTSPSRLRRTIPAQ